MCIKADAIMHWYSNFHIVPERPFSFHQICKFTIGFMCACVLTYIVVCFVLTGTQMAQFNLKTISRNLSLLLILYGLIGIHSFGLKKAQLHGAVCGDAILLDVTPYIGTCYYYCFLVIAGAVLFLFTIAFKYFSPKKVATLSIKNAPRRSRMLIGFNAATPFTMKL